jgi:hypothetical protein
LLTSGNFSDAASIGCGDRGGHSLLPLPLQCPFFPRPAPSGDAFRAEC